MGRDWRSQALFIVAGIAVVKYDGSPKLNAKRAEPAILGQTTTTTDPLAPATIAAPNARE